MKTHTCVQAAFIAALALGAAACGSDKAPPDLDAASKTVVGAVNANQPADVSPWRPEAQDSMDERFTVIRQRMYLERMSDADLKRSYTSASSPTLDGKEGGRVLRVVAREVIRVRQSEPKALIMDDYTLWKSIRGEEIFESFRTAVDAEPTPKGEKPWAVSRVSMESSDSAEIRVKRPGADQVTLFWARRPSGWRLISASR